MAHDARTISNKASSATPGSSQHVSSRFPDPLDCLAAHIVLECSEVLTGIKPANLVSIVNRQRPCGRNLYDLWLTHHDQLSSKIDSIRFTVLQTRNRALLLFCYNPEHLEQHLAHLGIRAILASAGYDIRIKSDALLLELRSRINQSGVFPHEIGLFIGYPAKDVAAFMGMVKLPFSCQGPWKIFGDPNRSLCLADDFRRSRRNMEKQLAACSSPFECLDQY